VPERGQLIAEIPLRERPRERLVAGGVGVLSDEELVAVLLCTGAPGIPVMGMARELVEQHGGLTGLLGATLATLRRPGLGAAKAAALMAAFEIGRRLAQGELRSRKVLARPAEVARYLLLRYQQRDQEVMGALFLDARHRLLGEREIFRGTLHRAAVEPREILKDCLLRGASGVALFHTHPSGDPTPSAEDLLFTRRMAEAAEVIGVELVDHLILGSPGRWVSLRERGAW
jgi:DNA repair protein RadC